MKNGMTCEICERDINSPSPKTESFLKAAKDEGLIEQKATLLSEPSAELRDGTLAHEACKEMFDFLNSLGTPPEIVERRLKGYRAGKSFEAYMNWPNGLEAPSVNSYRVLVTAYDAMHHIWTHWSMGNILPGECFRLDESRSILMVQDLDLKESALTRWYADMAQTALSYAVILWQDSHKTKDSRAQEMFLEWSMYTANWEVEKNHFNDMRHKAIAHIERTNWDSYHTNRSYNPYPNWSTDWKRFQELLGYSIYLCKKDIAQRLGEPEPDLDGHPFAMGRGGDPIQAGVDLMNSLGLPRTTGVGERPPMQGPYPFRHDGTKWVEVSNPR